MTEEKTNLPRMRTIREVAKLGILSENCLRQMQKQGKNTKMRSQNFSTSENMTWCKP